MVHLPHQWHPAARIGTVGAWAGVHLHVGVAWRDILALANNTDRLSLRATKSKENTMTPPARREFFKKLAWLGGFAALAALRLLKHRRWANALSSAKPRNARVIRRR